MLKCGVKRVDQGSKLPLAAWRQPEGMGVKSSAMWRQPKGMEVRGSMAENAPRGSMVSLGNEAPSLSGAQGVVLSSQTFSPHANFCLRGQWGGLPPE